MSKQRAVLKQQLEIDTDDLDRCLIDHSTLIVKVWEAYVEAVAEYDAIELVIKELTAEHDEEFRNKAEAEGKKLTEVAIKQAIRRVPKMQELQRDLLAAKLQMGLYEALKEGFHKRSFDLYKLVDRDMAHLGALSVERGVSGVRRDLTSAKAEINKREIVRKRREG